MINEYGYEYHAFLDEKKDKETAGKCVSHSCCGAILLRSGRDALKTIAREYKNATVFLSALSCESMAEPFLLYGHRIIYYKILSDYSVDYEDLIAKINKTNETILFVYMNYFGKLAITDEQLVFIKEKYCNVIFIEDNTHDLIYPKQNMFLSDYSVASLRKWVNVADGGLLWARKSLKNTEFSSNTAFSEERRKAQHMRAEYFKTGNESFKTEYRKIFSTVTKQIDKELLPGRMTEYSYHIALAQDWSRIREVRERNAIELMEILKNCKNITFIQKNTNKSNLYVPILIEKRDLIQKELAEKRIFTTLIWPLNCEQKKLCKIADYTEKYMLGIPCDQRYTVNDMRFIGEEIIKKINSL